MFLKRNISRENCAIFISSSSVEDIIIEKFHLCTWLFSDTDDEVLEIGILFKFTGVKTVFELSIPKYQDSPKTQDLYPILKESSNAKFIFNDAVKKIENLDKGDQKDGVVITFQEAGEICFLPCKPNWGKDTQLLSLGINIPEKEQQNLSGKSCYVRFCIKHTKIARIKNSISKRFVFYDMRVNEPRNSPEKVDVDHLCQIKSCYCLHILPSNYEMQLLDRQNVKSIRMLEVDGFQEYIKTNQLLNHKIHRDELLVVFNKIKRVDKCDFSTPISFFSIFEHEYLGVSQIGVAITLNLICNILCLQLPRYGVIFSIVFALVLVLFLGFCFYRSRK